MNAIKLFIAMFTLSLTQLSVVAQHSVDFSRIDKWAKYQKLRDTALVSFTQGLVGPARNDLERIRAIYQFVIHFLDYDRTAYALDKRRVNQNVYDILQRKKGICLDYAQLVCKMCEIAGLECKTITGFSKNLATSKVNVEPDHAWNLIQIDTNFYLIDPTWASNTLYTTDLFKEKYRVDYFITDPSLFVVNHYPNLPMWQLLECPVSFNDFLDERLDYLEKDLCLFNYKDSIEVFNKLPLIDQKIIEQASVYQYQPNNLNKSAWAHALLDKAVNLKENADELFQHKLIKKSIYIYQDALALFGLAAQNTELYRWQKEARGFCHLNYAQALYKQEQDKAIAEVRSNFVAAKEHLISLNTTSTMVLQALTQIDKTLTQLK